MPSKQLITAAAAILVILPALIVLGWTQPAPPADTTAPVPVWQTADNFISDQSCLTCHEEQVTNLQHAPHMRTLQPANTDLVLSRFLGKQYESDLESIRFELDASGDLICLSSNFPRPIKVHWVFGSGQHAMTPVSLVTDAAGQDRLVQLRVSWYPEDILDLTLGQTTNDSELTGLARIGAISDHAETMNCFGCHVAYVDGQEGINLEAIQPGVGCIRCHQDAKRHLQAMTNGVADPSSIDSWKQLTAIESINRCGGCHRRQEDFTPEELNPPQSDLPRLASVGLAMSPCFTPEALPEDPRRMDCMTCHNPHQPATVNSAHYVAACMKCHGETSNVSTSCSQHPHSDRCLDCHMPKVEISPRLHFTDHWIRVRDLSDSPSR